MAEYKAEIVWSRGEQNFLDNRYSRVHTLRFDGGIEVLGSSSPQVVPVPLSEPAAVDPEEAFVASLSSCHMLWFLAIAAKRKFCVDSYTDTPVGVLNKNADGKMAITLITLRPQARFSGEPIPTREQIVNMHTQAHEQCFIANSVKSEVRCEPA